MSATSQNDRLEQRIARLEARAEIRALIARYCFTIDARDVVGIGECFTRDGRFRSLDGKMDAVGRDAVVAQFHGRFAVLGPSNHFTHDQLVEFIEGDPSRARGLVNSHAEVVRNGEPLLAALRYHDEYRLEEGRWRFADRALEFFYYLNPREYGEVLLSPLRNRAYATPHAADYPERLESWQAYYRERPRS
ncbi:MAG TPA: nuclear transport factor 2 family protein [Steroidobacteraceae bacterium]|nr:nuclear transport factor 2 family protein [Steroidobacteraceae bacterium]